MKTFAIASLLAGIGYALPQQAQRSCDTVTETVTVPTSTNVRLSTYITLITATTPENWGTHTDLLKVSTTRDLVTLTSTETECTATGTITAQPTSTVYTAAGTSSSDSPPHYYPRNDRRDDDGSCTVTETSTTSYGVLYTHSPAHATSTWTRYTDHTVATTVTETRSGFTDYNIVTATTTVPELCGPTVNATSSNSTSTTTLDARCAPSAMASAAGFDEQYAPEGYGISYAQLAGSGAVYETNATDASACCQLCAEAEDGCAASAWDSRTGSCKISFPVGYSTGELSCGTGFYAFYNYGPNHPMEPGSGLFVAELCGSVGYFSAKPDDGT